MRHIPSTLHFSHVYPPAAAAGSIEWEELPSLAERVHARPGILSTASTWDNTLPAPLQAAPMSPPFSELLQGVAMREVSEPDVFLHFFGR